MRRALEGPPGARLGRWVWPLLALLPPVLVLALILRYFVDVPVWDEWHVAEFVCDTFEGRLSWEALWRQHNEHRDLVHDLARLALAFPTRWSHRVEALANLAIASATALCCVFYLVRVRRRVENLPLAFLIPVTSLFVFNLLQWESWMWGVIMGYFLAVLFVHLQTVTLVYAGGARTRLAGGILFSFAASYSQGHGLASWFSGLLILLVRPGPPRARTRDALVWLAAAATCFLLYFEGYERPPHHPELVLPFADLGLWARYLLAFLGSIFQREELAGAAGALGVLVFLGLAVHLRKRAPSTVILPFLALGCFVIVVAAMVATGRSGFGVGQALRSRYITFTYAFWWSLVVLSSVALASRMPGRPGAPEWARRAGRWLLRLTAWGIPALVLLASWSVFPSYGARHLQLSEAREELIAPFRDWDRLGVLSQDRERVRVQRERLKRLRLSLFRDEETRRRAD